MVGYNMSSKLAAPWLAISVVDIDPGPFTRLTFGVSSDRAGAKPEVKRQERFLEDEAKRDVLNAVTL